jgi:hypothetical protein
MLLCTMLLCTMLLCTMNVVILNLLMQNVIMLNAVTQILIIQRAVKCHYTERHSAECRCASAKQRKKLQHLNKIRNSFFDAKIIAFFLFKWVLNRGPEQRESKLTVLCPLIITI